MGDPSPSSIIAIVGNSLFLVVQFVTYFKTKRNVSEAGEGVVKGTAAQITVNEVKKIAEETKLVVDAHTKKLAAIEAAITKDTGKPFDAAYIPIEKKKP